MTAFKRYFDYRLKKSVGRTLVLMLLALMFTHSVIGDATRSIGFYDNTVPDAYRSTGLGFIAFLLGLLCSIIPIAENAELKNRRNLDTLYFFPIDRKLMALTHFLSGLLQVFLIYGVTYLYASTFWIAHRDTFALSLVLPYFLLSLAVGFVIYAVISFLFIEANTVGDGICFCLLGIFACFMLAGGISEILSPIKLPFDFSWMILYGPLNNLTTIFRVGMEYQKTISEYQTETLQMIRDQMYMFVLWGIVGVAATFGYFRTFLMKGAERAEDFSDSWFGYRVMIPLYGYTLLLTLGSSMDLFSLLILLLMTVGYFIYRRSFKFQKSDLFILLGSILIMVCGSVF